MPLSYKGLTQDSDMRRKFFKLNEEDRNIAFSQMAVPEGLQENDVAEYQKRLQLAADTPKAWKDVGADAVSNLVPSTIDLAKNVWQAVRHPIQTGTALGKVAVGGIEKAIPGGEDKNVEAFDQTMSFFKDRYGGSENLKNTIAEDPAGFLSDLSIFLGPAGGGVGAAVRGAKIGGEVGNILKTVGKVGNFTKRNAASLDVPTALARSLKVGLRKSGTTKSVKSLVKSAVKFREPFGPSKLKLFDKLAQEFLDSGKDVSRNSIRKLDIDIKQKGRIVSSILKDADKSGLRIPVTEVTSRLDDLIQEIKAHPLDTIDTNANLKVLEGFRNSMLNSKNATIGKLPSAKINNIINKVFKGGKGTIDKAEILKVIGSEIAKARKGTKNALTRSNIDMMEKFASKIDSLSPDKIAPNFTGLNKKAVQSAFKDFVKENAVLKPSEVQNLKVTLNKKFVPDLITGVDAVKAVATDQVRIATKEILEKQLGLKELNLSIKQSIDFKNAIEDTLLKVESGNTFGSGTGVITGGLAGGVTGITTAGAENLGKVLTGTGTFVVTAGIAQKILSNPNFQLRLAKILNASNNTRKFAGELGDKLSRPSSQAGRAAKESGADKLTESDEQILKEIRGF